MAHPVRRIESMAEITKISANMGATDPKKAVPGTLRRMFGTGVTHNAVHGSDAVETACQEIALFFPGL